MKELRKQLEEALIEIHRLKQENEELRRQLTLEDSASLSVEDKEPASVSSGINQYSSPKEKIVLFRSLFGGREDVYAIRWENKAGKSGYSPACGNEWTAVCKKPQVKCSECSHQHFLPITDETISKHLDAKTNQTMGIYSLQENETCWFLAIDFDKKNWKEDVTAVRATCRAWNLPAAVERSRSGNGAHLWIFFEMPVAASLARRLGSAILTRTMDSRYQVGFDSYDRLFPNQDTLPRGGFGNLIALPLQGQPRKSGNSVFVDDRMEPYPDQWVFLSSLQKLSIERIEEIVWEAARAAGVLNAAYHDDIEESDLPWESKQKVSRVIILEEMPTKVCAVNSNMIYLSKEDLPTSAINRLIGLAAFQNPDFYKAQAMRMSTYGKPRVIGCADDFPKHIALPRGCMEQVAEFLRMHDTELVIQDERENGIPIEAEFTGTLSMLQDTAARAVLAHDTGILSASTAFGKTVVAANIIAKRKTSTLILVHRRELMDQWKERLGTFLTVPDGTIGFVGGGKDKRTGKIDIAVIQSLNKQGQVKEIMSKNMAKSSWMNVTTFPLTALSKC